MSLGPGINEFDVYNYHIYAPWAFFNNRYTVDVLPCGIRSYFNPYLDIPFYILLKYFNNFPKFITFIQGFWYGAIIFCAYKLSTLIVFNEKFKNTLFRILCIIMTAFAPIIFYEAGTCFNDLITGVFICSALYLYLKVLFDEDSKIRTYYILGGSILLGIIAGLKLTSIIMIFGIFISIICLNKFIDKPFKVISLYFLGGIASFIIFNGYWYYKMWRIFKNPVFPFMNNIFKSPYGEELFILNDSYTRSIPSSFIDKLFYLFIRIKNFGTRDSLINYTDYRYLLGTLSVVYMLIKYSLKKFKLENKNDKIILFLIIFTISTYIMWLNLFATIRYIIPLILVIGIIIIYTLFNLFLLFKSKKIFVFNLILLMLFYFSKIKINLYNIREKYSNTLLEEISYNIPDNSLVLMVNQMTSFAIPQLNHKAKYYSLIYPLHMDNDIRNKGWFVYKKRTIDYYYSGYYEYELKKLFKEKNNIYLIFSSKESELIKEALSYYTDYKKRIKIRNCKDFHHNRITICKFIK